MPKPQPPTPTQIDALDRIVASGGAQLEYRAGGYWTLVGCPERPGGAPEWWITWQTVRAMEARGWLARVGCGAESWPRRNRAITELGVKASSSIREAPEAGAPCP